MCDKIKQWKYYLKSSKVILIIGFIAIIIITVLLWGHLKFEDENLIRAYRANVISLFVALTSVLISIVTLYKSKEDSIFQLTYENSKNSMINLIKIINYLSRAYKEEPRYEYLDYILETNNIENHNIDFLKRWGSVEITNIFTDDKKTAIEDMQNFKRNNELYYLPVALRMQLADFMKSRENLTDEDIEKILGLVKELLKKDYGIVV